MLSKEQYVNLVEQAHLILSQLENSSFNINLNISEVLPVEDGEPSSLSL